MFQFFQAKNVRRKEKREALNVKMRAGDIRSRRVRLLGTLLGFSLSLFLLVMLGWKGAEYLLREAVYTNPHLAIDRIDVETDGVLAPEKIRQWARVKKGENLLALDLSRLKRDLELRPIIASAAAEKILPRQLRISVTERKPLAVVYLYHASRAGLPAGLDRLYLDAAGMVIPPLRSDERNPDARMKPGSLPVLTGLNANELRPGAMVSSPQVRAALDLLVLYERSPVPALAEFRSVDLSSARTLTVTTDQKIEITFSSDNFPRQLARLETTLQFARRQNRIPSSLDLAVGNYVPLRWAEPATNAPISLPSIPLNLKPRKKHV